MTRWQKRCACWFGCQCFQWRLITIAHFECLQTYFFAFCQILTMHSLNVWCSLWVFVGKDRPIWLILCSPTTQIHTQLDFNKRSDENAQTFAQRQNTNEFHSPHHFLPYLCQKMKMNYATGPKVIYLGAIKQMRFHSIPKSHLRLHQPWAV